jgi:hypothetical protein
MNSLSEISEKEMLVSMKTANQMPNSYIASCSVERVNLWKWTSVFPSTLVARGSVT